MLRIKQAADMLMRAEHCRASALSFIATHSLEHSQAVMEAVRQNMDVGLVIGDHRSVHPNLFGAQTVCRQGLPTPLVASWSCCKSSRWLRTGQAARSDQRLAWRRPQLLLER